MMAVAAICTAGLPVTSVEHGASAAQARHYSPQIHPLIGDDAYLVSADGPARHNGRLGTPVATYVRVADGSRFAKPS
jgi:hypothetical protein